MPDNKLLLSSTPHAYSAGSTRKIMLAVIIALLPATGYGVYLFGLPALLVILTSVVAAVVAEAGFRLVTKQDIRIGDLSAVVTGLLLALICPPSIPLWMVALGSAAAIIFAKEFLGGLGANPFNPALIGRGILLMSFPAAMTTWHLPVQTIGDVVTGATPLNIVKMGGSLADVANDLAANGLAAGNSYSDMLWTLFLGNRAGCIGESSILLILVGLAFLLLTRVVNVIVPLAMMGSTFLFSWLFGLDPVFGILSGGVVFGAVFMATDYSSSPLPPFGKLIFGTGAGFLTAIIRKFGGFPEGVTYSILIMNAIAPYLDKLRVKKYGFIKPAKPVKEAAK
ncbi:MAG: NADH-quinone reductase [Spirochaetes bacterium GWD1_61_31]|nr:MAG: NADH-quinone reductase [Spirochaetes bacterium GWB1_60_80]OHD34308.1 MAG: NADH-quinone reductase [Spirochaetes bacterium GWC1_61_12]OHD40237.1 MAG: NADH-quinone reductase [Spirochaetes bacterium GWD1_61_31]OHD45716.1 MAG: NADH-quinone reductase [Spirochaetes bacterium GWE1_60_18]OHD59883.1 MAG: NADH-quinone reductase [Spirochaetes bacterium GWF1_60_12]